jgi:hypothetical protein
MTRAPNNIGPDTSYRLLPLLLICAVGIFGEIYLVRAPTLHTKIDGEHVRVYVHKYGALWPSVSRIRIVDKSSGVTIIDLVPANGRPCLYLFSLTLGSNYIGDINRDANCAMYQSFPSGTRDFMLEKGRPYLLSIWGRYQFGPHTDSDFEFN